VKENVTPHIRPRGAIDRTPIHVIAEISGTQHLGLAHPDIVNLRGLLCVMHPKATKEAR
jgi:hypothetical protein